MWGGRRWWFAPSGAREKKKKKTNEASSSRRRGGLEKTAGPSPAVWKQQGPFPQQGQQACTHTHTHAYAHTRRNSWGGKSRAFKINNAMRHEHAGYSSGRRLPPRVQPNRAGGRGNQPSLPPSSPPLPVSWRGWVRGWGGPDNHASSRGPCRLLAAGRALHRRYCLYWGAGDGRGSQQSTATARERERENLSQGTLRRGEKIERRPSEGARACTHPSPTWKWPTLLHLYTPRHACSIYIYIMYIRMLYYYAMLTSHCNILKRERGEGGGKGSARGEGKKKDDGETRL